MQKSVSLHRNQVQKNVLNVMEKLVTQQLVEWKGKKDRNRLLFS